RRRGGGAGELAVAAPTPPPPGSLLSSVGRTGARRVKRLARVPGGQIRRAVGEAARSGRSARWGSRRSASCDARRKRRRAGRQPAGLPEAGTRQGRDGVGPTREGIFRWMKLHGIVGLQYDAANRQPQPCKGTR
ncbi:unnamed protein product, partial [Urochloa humidicola]